MKTISTRVVETPEDIALVYALRYEYYIGARELDLVAADHASRWLRECRDDHALQFGTFAGEDLVGCFRIEIGRPADLSFGADWAFTDFLDELPQEVGLVTGMCTSAHLRDQSVIMHMVAESVAIARELAITNTFFELCPDLWPLFHAAGLHRRGGSLPHRQSGLQTAVFHLDRSDRQIARRAAAVWSGQAISNDAFDLDEEALAATPPAAPMPRLKLVVGGR